MHLWSRSTVAKASPALIQGEFLWSLDPSHAAPSHKRAVLRHVHFSCSIYFSSALSSYMDYTGHTQDVISGGPESNHAANTWITTEEPPELSTSPGASDYSSSILCEDPTTFELLAEFVQPDYSTQYWDPSASSWAWTLPANCPVFENTLLQNTPFTPDYTYFTSSASEAQTTEDRKPRNRRSPASSVASSDSDVSLEQDDGQQQCRECRQKYDNFQSLDKHARETNHRSWACPISDCTKAYVRRDVFLRHRSTHREGGFRCPVCRKDKDKNFKQFKRKDHFKEHMRKCHPSWKSDRSVTPASRPSQDKS